MKNKIYLFGFLFFFLSNISFSQDTETRKAINQYVDYLNHCNLYISATHYSVKDLNLTVFQTFNDPSHFYTNRDFFKLKCSPGSITCNEKLNIVQIFEQSKNLIESIENLELETKNELLSSLNHFNALFKELVQEIEDFEEKTYTADFFLDPTNIEKIKTNLYQYKTTVESLDKALKEATVLCTTIFNEPTLPKPLERTKSLVVLIKESLDNANIKDSVLFNKQLQEVQLLINQHDKGTDLVRMEEFGNFDHLDNIQVQERANIERYTQDVVNTANKLLAIKKYDSPFDYGIRTYDSIVDPEKQQYIYRMERLSSFFNDNTNKSVIKNYNDYIKRAKTPIMNMVGIVLPYEIIEIEIKLKKDIQEVADSTITEVDTNPDNLFSKDDISTLAGSKHTNLVLVLDISASMRGDDKITRLKKAITHLIDLLRPEDILTIIVYSAETKVIFNSHGMKYSKTELKDLINEIEPHGGTNIKNALDKAYQICNKNYIKDGNNKIIVATDGFFKLEKKGEHLIKKNKTITLSTFLFKGKDTTKKEENVLVKMAALGKGSATIINAEDDIIQSLIIEIKEKK